MIITQWNIAITLLHYFFIKEVFEYFFNLYCNILDRHHVWRSHDPTSIRLFTYVKKKDVTPPFYLKKMQLFVIRFFLCFVSFCV